jgi:DNA invertase Pin-like site-specific DNA recombinase
VDTWADTTTPHGRLMLTVLGGLAEFERELIRARTGEGRKRAQARGVKFGRPRKLTVHQRQEALERLAAGETQADVARTYNVDATTIGRLLTVGAEGNRCTAYRDIDRRSDSAAPGAASARGSACAPRSVDCEGPRRRTQ